MIGLKDLKNRIKSVNSTHQLTAAMKLLASSKLKHLMSVLVLARNYKKTLTSTLYWALQDLTPEELEKYKQKLPWYFTQQDTTKPHAILVFGANKGLCGNYNLQSIRDALSAAEQYASQTYSFIPLTLKTSEYFSKHHPNQTESIPGLGHFELQTSFIELAAYVLENLIRRFENNKMGSVSIIHGKFRNALVQKIEHDPLFPIFQKIDPPEQIPFDPNLPIPVIEPSKFEILEKSVKHFALISLYISFLESETCEQAARVTMMESAKHNAEDLISSLTLQYNRTRQANITNELIEIIAGTSVLASD